jgi:hypothetical protein
VPTLNWWMDRLMPRSSRAAVLAETVRWADDADVPALAQRLMPLAEKDPVGPAIPAMCTRWANLSAPHKQTLRDLIAADWPYLVAHIAGSPRSVERATAMKLAHEFCPLAACDLAQTLLADPDPAVADHAEAVLAEAARLAPAASSEQKTAMKDALEAVIENFDRHRRTSALRLAIRHGGLADRPVSMAWMKDEQHPAHLVVRGLLRRGSVGDSAKATSPQELASLRACALSWLKHPALASACRDRLSMPATLPEHAAVLSRSHLMLNPQREAQLTPRPGVALDPNAFVASMPKLGEIDALPSHSRSNLPRWLSSLPISPRLKDAASAILLTDPDPAVRHALVRAASQSARASCLFDMVFDPDERVAMSAALCLLCRTGSDRLEPNLLAKTLQAARRSPHAAIRQFAITLESRPITTEPDQTADTPLSLPETSPRSLATMAAKLGTREIPLDRAMPILQELATAASDARVQANAIESLGRKALQAPHDAAGPIVEVLLDRLLDPHHRVRANAARGLYLLASAIEDKTLLAASSRTMDALLTDARSMHRVAGLWLVHRMAHRLPDHASLLHKLEALTPQADTPLESLRIRLARQRLTSELAGDIATVQSADLVTSGTNS